MTIIDHIGIAVPELDPVILDYEKSFGCKLSLRENVREHGVEVAFLDFKEPSPTSAYTSIELLAPIGSKSKLADFLAKRGPGMHHICYRVDNIEADLKRLAAQGFQLIDQKPRPGARGTVIAFIHPKSTHGVLTELCQYCEK